MIKIGQNRTAVFKKVKKSGLFVLHKNRWISNDFCI